MTTSGSARAVDVLRPGCLADRVALVTGGGSGIGRSTAIELARLGAQVVVLGRRADALEQTRDLCHAHAGGLEVMVVPVDLREFDDVDEAITAILDRHDRIDLLVNNAGGQFVSPAQDITAKGFRAVTRLNLEAPWYLTTQVAARSMIPHGYGKVVSITMTPQRGMPFMAHSSAARSAVESLTRTLAAEWGPLGVRLVAVAPGIVQTEAWGRYGLDPVDVAEVIPLRRLQGPEEIAAMVAFLLSTAGDYVTGTTIVADGGFNVSGPSAPSGAGR